MLRANMRGQAVCLGFMLVLGMALAAVVVVPRFTSVGQAVQQLPELSILNAQVQQIALAQQLNSPDFVGTVFAPINAGVQKLVDAGGLSMAGNGVDDIFKMAVLTTKVELGELYNGQTLTAMNGQTLTVKITNEAGGNVYWINNVRITTANILAGKAVIHEVSYILLPNDLHTMLSQMGYGDPTTVAPTVEYANPTQDIPDPEPSPSPEPEPSPSPSPSPSTSGNSGSTPDNSGSTTSPSPSPKPSPSPSPKPSPSPSPKPASSPAPSTGTTTGTGTTTTGSSSSVTTESGAKVDPDWGLDISAGHSPVLTMAMLAIPLLLAAVL